MSAGVFNRSFYELDNGEICRCRVQPETEALFAGAAGPATQSGSARLAGSRRTFGVNARYISAEWNGAPPTGYDPNGVLRIPVLTPADYNGVELGDDLTYLGGTITVIGKTGEKIN